MTLAPGRLTDDGIWVSGTPKKGARQAPGLLLDRDGVLVEEVHYLHRREDVRLAPGAVALLHWAKGQGLPVAVVTNQAGIARGLFGWDEFLAVEDEIARQLAAEGVALDLTLACPFHPDHTRDWSKAHAYWRKPGPGMLLQAGQMLNLDLSKSWMVGDNESDIAAAKAAGLTGGVHVLTGHGTAFREAAIGLKGAGFGVLPAGDLVEALAVLRSHLVAEQ